MGGKGDASDGQGTELRSPNEQMMYLHVVRFGVKGEGGAGELLALRNSNPKTCGDGWIEA